MFFAPWDTLLASSGRVRILRTLHGAGRALSGREAARLARMSLPVAQRALARLTAAGVVLREEASAQHLYRLNRAHLLVSEGLVPLFAAEERRVHATFDAIVRAVCHEMDALDDAVRSVYLFGSAARGDDRVESDFDVLVVARDAESAERAHDRLAAAAPGLRERFGVVLSPVAVDAARARELARDASSVVSAALREGRRIHGEELEAIVDGHAGEEKAG